MRKHILKTVAAIVSVAVCLSANIPIFASNEICSYGGWINEEGEYAFPITQYDEAWYEFESVVDMRVATQLPEELLNDISTKELVRLVLKYPLLCDMKAYSIEEGYAHIKEQFNGIQELVSREDAYEELLAAYDSYDIPAERILDYDSIIKSEEDVDAFNELCSNMETRKLIYDDAEIPNSLNVLEFMLLDVMVKNEIDAAEFVNVYGEKVEQKSSSEYYAKESPLMLVESIADNEINPLSAYICTPTSSDEPYEMYITTPDGHKVLVKYSPKLTICNYSEYADLISAYNANSVSVASTTFNCHSYAWLKDLRSDYQHIWLNTSSWFTSDPYYEKSSSAKVGDIATWAAHSAIVLQANVKDPYSYKDVPENYCISKWAGGPIVTHYMKRCPYYTEGANITYYRPK